MPGYDLSVPPVGHNYIGSDKYPGFTVITLVCGMGFLERTECTINGGDGNAIQQSHRGDLGSAFRAFWWQAVSPLP